MVESGDMDEGDDMLDSGWLDFIIINEYMSKLGLLSRLRFGRLKSSTSLE